MAAKHTPGPWSQHDDHPLYGKGYACFVWGPQGPGHGLVADCGQRRGEENVANAKLVAAAPDLFAALKQCCDELGSIHYGGDDVEHAEKHSAGYRLARAALAKAEA